MERISIFTSFVGICSHNFKCKSWNFVLDCLARLGYFSSRRSSPLCNPDLTNRNFWHLQFCLNLWPDGFWDRQWRLLILDFEFCWDWFLRNTSWKTAPPFSGSLVYQDESSNPEHNNFQLAESCSTHWYTPKIFGPNRLPLVFQWHIISRRISILVKIACGWS